VLPPGLAITIELTTPVHETDAVGMQIAGRVAADVMVKRKVVVPAGAAVHGRVRRLERHSDFGPYFAVGLEFTDIEIGGAAARFYAILQDVVGKGPVQLMLRRQVAPRKDESWRTEEMYLTYLPGVASFFVKGSRLTGLEGLRTVWRTKAAR
jgi:hypothetical protein